MVCCRRYRSVAYSVVSADDLGPAQRSRDAESHANDAEASEADDRSTTTRRRAGWSVCCFYLLH